MRAGEESRLLLCCVERRALESDGTSAHGPWEEGALGLRGCSAVREGGREGAQQGEGRGG